MSIINGIWNLMVPVRLRDNHANTDNSSNHHDNEDHQQCCAYPGLACACFLFFARLDNLILVTFCIRRCLFSPGLDRAAAPVHRTSTVRGSGRFGLRRCSLSHRSDDGGAGSGVLAQGFSHSGRNCWT